MKNGLPRSRVHIENGSVPLLVNRSLRCDSLRHLKHMGEEWSMFGEGVIQRRNVNTRTDQHVNRSLRSDVFECEHAIVFVDLLRRRLAADDFAE